MTDLSVSSLDIGVIVIYFIGVFWMAYKITDQSRMGDSQEYFLAGRGLGWFLVGSSLFASNIGSEHLIGLAGAGASSGVAVGQFEVLACFMLLLLGWVFVPFYLKTGVVTMPEFLEKRFSPQARNYLTLISIVGYVLTKISVTIYAGAVVFEAMGVPFWLGAGIVVITTGAYTIFGGLKAVIYTDALQMVVMLVGAVTLTYLGIQSAGGLSEVQNTLEPSFMSMWRPLSDPDFPWTGILFGAPILGVWYWCTDQYVVQRTLSARNIKQARRGSLFAGYLKILPLFIFVFPGLICATLAKQGQLELASSDQALPALAAFVMPVGLKGLFIAGLLAALMSSLSSVFNSCSTLISFEVFKRNNPNLKDSQLVTIGRISTVVLVIVGILWIPLMKLVSGQLFTYIQSVQAYISPPVAAVFLLGVLWPKINSKGAMTALYTGFVIGIARLVSEIMKDSVTLPPMIDDFARINFLHFAAALFVLSCCLMIAVSFMTGGENASGKKFQSLLQSETTMKIKSNIESIDYILTAGLIASVFAIWWVFS